MNEIFAEVRDLKLELESLKARKEAIKKQLSEHRDAITDEEIAKSRKDKSIIAEWFPVEGVLLGVLNVKRELRALEVGKLKQSIYALETELKNEGVEPLITIPRLINNYFWLIDHYTTIREDRSKITEILLKIKLLNADVYERYTV